MKSLDFMGNINFYITFQQDEQNSRDIDPFVYTGAMPRNYHGIITFTPLRLSIYMLYLI